MHPYFPLRGLWMASASCWQMGQSVTVLKYWNFRDVSMVYGTIIFEAGTWEPSLTRPSSLSPHPSHGPHSQGRKGHKLAGRGLRPTWWLIGMNLFTTLEEGSWQCWGFFY